MESHSYQPCGRPLTLAPNRDHYTRFLQQRRHVLVAKKKTKGKEMPRATCTGTSERKKKKETTKENNLSSKKKIVLQQHAPQRITVVVRVQPSNKVKSQTLHLWALPTRRSSTDSSILPTFPLSSSFSCSSVLAPPDVNVAFLAQGRHFCSTPSIFVQSCRSSVLSTAPFVTRE